jgi:hypothetical protein
MVSVIIFVCAIVSIFFPAMVYVPSVLICVMASSLFGVKLGYGASAISYFGALPFVGMMFFLFLPKPVKLRVSVIFTDNSLVEYLGLILIFIWYLASMFEIYSNGLATTNEVVIPLLRSPVTSIGLWFAGMLLGVVISFGVHKSINFFWGKK